jgi:5-methyltetrahydrofolate--homocysteine methyltransferase
MKPSLSSLYQATEIRQPLPPLLIGERTNANGSKLFRERLLENDYQGCLQIGLAQEASGAQVLDLCAAYAGRDELLDMTELVTRCARSVKIPLMIDSTTPEVIEACLKLYPGRCIVNSINLEDGGRTARRVCALLKKYGAAVVALTIDESGMAMTAEAKVATARRIYDLAVGEFGLRPADLLFDALTFTVGAGDANLRDAAVQTLRAITEIKAAMPGVGTVLGLSNISFGLSPASRKVLNSVFLHEAVEAGLDAAIVDAAKILPLAKIQSVDRKVCLDLLYDRSEGQAHDPLLRFIEHFKTAPAAGAAAAPAEARFERAEQSVFAQVVDGSKEHLEDNLAMLVQRLTPIAVINQILVPAMRHVGELFGRGELLLPFVLQSAEVMKHAVSWLEPRMEKGDVRAQTRVLLATVQGDVHDIGKNLVDIILSNNGYKVFNLGIKVPTETIIEKARELQADVIGLSGLLVKSAMVMKESMRQYRDAGLTQPILLGGAALTPRFVAEACAPEYGAPVVYCSDAFAGLKAVRAHEEGRLVSTVWSAAGAAVALKPGARDADIARDNPVPPAPFLGVRYVEEIALARILPHMNLQALFRGRWGYRRAKLSAEAYDKLVAEKVQPIYDGLVRRAEEEGLILPRVAYGYYRCFSAGDALHVIDGDATRVFAFPRQALAPHLCVADYFKSEKEGGDIAGFFVVSVGEAIDREAHELYQANRYHDYLMLHGFGVEMTDALAEYWHAVMRRELGIAGSEPSEQSGYVTQTYQGGRFGFGYPACPDLDAHKPIFDMLRPERIGVTLTENMQMVPEQTTSAIIAHHPQAKYFAV